MAFWCFVFFCTEDHVRYLINSSSFSLPLLFIIAKQNAVTHKKIEEGVHEVKFRWTAPAGLRERVTFYATVAKNGGVFWIAQKSEVLSIN